MRARRRSGCLGLQLARALTPTFAGRCCDQLARLRCKFRREFLADLTAARPKQGEARGGAALQSRGADSFAIGFLDHLPRPRRSDAPPRSNIASAPDPHGLGWPPEPGRAASRPRTSRRKRRCPVHAHASAAVGSSFSPVPAPPRSLPPPRSLLLPTRVHPHTGFSRARRCERPATRASPACCSGASAPPLPPLTCARARRPEHRHTTDHHMAISSPAPRPWCVT